jgi:IBR domain, a half RING-finger domain
MGFTTFIKRLKYAKRTKKGPPNHSLKPAVEDECLVCLETEQCLTTSQCKHPICVSCLGTYIAVTHQYRMPCPCPSSAFCEHEFTIDDIAPYVDDVQIAKIWLVQAGLQIDSGLGMYCPRSTCSKPILWKSRAAKRAGATGKCRSCSQPVCISCKSAYHTNLTYHLVRFC